MSDVRQAQEKRAATLESFWTVFVLYKVMALQCTYLQTWLYCMSTRIKSDLALQSRGILEKRIY